MPIFRRATKPDPPADEPAEKPPTGRERRSSSGRGHTGGYLQLEEYNPDLRHPASHAVYDEMYRTDADVHQVVQLTVNPITGGTWSVDPFGGAEATDEDVKIAEACQWALLEHMTPSLKGHLAEFLPVVFRSGFAPGEKVWGYAEYEGQRLLCPTTVGLMLPRSVWRWNQKDGRLESVTQTVFASNGSATYRDGFTAYGGGAAGGDGPSEVTVPARDLVYYRVGAEGDNWEGVSLLRPAYKHWYLKDRIERIDAIAQEREATGIPVVYPPAGASPGQLLEMESILGNLRTNEQGYIVMPGQKAGISGTPDGTGWLLELLGFDRQGSGRDPHPSLQYHGMKIAAAFISEFMKLGHGDSGARATAQVQADPFLLSIEALVGLIEETLQRSLVVPFVDYNYPAGTKYPKIKMSKVDSTSLSQLADYVLKLTQVGALLPDQKLEAFLRARADMPPSDPDAVKDRKDTEEKTRRMIVGGDPEATVEQDPFGSNAPVGEHKNGKPAGEGQRRGVKGAKGSPAGRGAAGQNPSPRGAAKDLDRWDGTGVQLSVDDYLEAYAPPSRHERSRWWELCMDLDGLAGEMDAAPDGMLSACAPTVYSMARAMADAKTPLGDCDDDGGLRDQIHGRLCDHYDSGCDHVRRELGVASDGIMLDAGARDRGREHLLARADLAADQVRHAMRAAMLGADLTHGRVGHAQAAAEAAGQRMLRRVGHDHGVAALIHGRHDQGVQLAEEGIAVGSRYSAILDDHTCAACDEADDGIVRPLDDPVRLERRPPNPECASTASGHNRCRCVEVFEVADLPATSLDAAAAGPMPDWLQRVLGFLVARGAPETRAMQIAKDVATRVAADGKVLWPGLAQVGAGDQAGASAAVGWFAAAGL